MKNKPSSIVTEAINTPVSYDDAHWILSQAAELPADRRDFYGLMAIVMERFKGKEIHKASRQAFAFMERVRCLSDMCKTPKIKAWMRDSGLDDGSVLIEESIVKATANCPLQYNGKTDKIFFDENEFFDIALQERETEGVA